MTASATTTTDTAHVNHTTSVQTRSARSSIVHDVGVLVGRIGLGVLMIAHAKMTYDVAGGLGAAGQMFAGQGIPLGEVVGPATVLGEFFGGIAVILGLLTRVACLLMAATMAGAWIWVHTSGLFAMDGNGPELVIAIGLLCLVVAATGSGRYGVDHVITTRRRR